MSERIFFSVMFYNFGYYYGHGSINTEPMLGGSIGILLSAYIYYKVKNK